MRGDGRFLQRWSHFANSLCSTVPIESELIDLQATVSANSFVIQ